MPGEDEKLESRKRKVHVTHCRCQETDCTGKLSKRKSPGLILVGLPHLCDTLTYNTGAPTTLLQKCFQYSGYVKYLTENKWEKVIKTNLINLRTISTD